MSYQSSACTAMKRTLLSWSSGKDSAWSLYLLQQQKEYDVVALLTTFNKAADRVAMHGVRRSLVKAQAAAAGVPLWDVDLPWPCSNLDYECAMKETCKRAINAGIEHVAFGDLFLTDIRKYREEQLKNSGLRPLFPIWAVPTQELAHSMINSGVRAKLACVDCNQLPAGFIAGSSTISCSPNCPQMWIHVEKMGNFTHSFMPVRCSDTNCQSRWAKS
jgi:diphthamide synthase (EF-2-diphthine--ammonia ligase)